MNSTSGLLFGLALAGLMLVALSISFSFPNAINQGSTTGVRIDSFYYTGTQQLLNITFQLTNTGPVRENFTIKVLLDNVVVNTQNVTDFQPDATRWFTLPKLVSFDPISNHSGRLVADSAEFGFWTDCITNSYGHFCTVHYTRGSQEISCGLRPNDPPVSCIQTSSPLSHFENPLFTITIGIAGSILLVAALVARQLYKSKSDSFSMPREATAYSTSQHTTARMD